MNINYACLFGSSELKSQNHGQKTKGPRLPYSPSLLLPRDPPICANPYPLQSHEAK